MDDAQNLEERILKLRKSACSSGPKAVKANFFTASECLQTFVISLDKQTNICY